MTATQQQPAGSGVATVPPPVELARHNQQTFANVLPQHIEAKSFVGLAEACVRRSPELMEAATRSPRVHARYSRFSSATAPCLLVGAASDSSPGRSPYLAPPGKKFASR